MVTNATTFVLDASAILRFLDNEAGADRVEEVFKAAGRGEVIAIISAVNWGEVLGKLYKRGGLALANRLSERLIGYNLQVIQATAEREARSAYIKEHRRIPYADAFGVELASDSHNHILLTADFDVKPAEADITIEFLPTKRIM